LVAEDSILAPREGGDEGEIGNKSAGEDERGLRALPVGEVAFQGTQWRQQARDQRRGARPTTVAAGGAGSGPCEARVGRQVQVIVGGEVDQLPPAQADARSLGRE